MYSSCQTFKMTGNQSELKIQKLNDDCLLHICRFLSLCDRLVLRTTCNRFYHLFRTEVEITSTEMQIIAKQLHPQQFFSVFGQDIRKISLTWQTVDRLVFLPEYCHNLEYLQFYYPENYSWNFDFVKLQNLRTLKIVKGCELSGEVLQKIAQLQKLEVLHIDYARIDIECLHGLTTLTELYLTDCHHITTEGFIKVTTSNRNLKRLSILRCKTLGSAAFQSLVTAPKNLEYLAFDDSALTSCSFLAELRPLKSVHVTGTNSANICSIAIHELALHHSESLEELACTSKSEAVSELALPTNASFPRLTKMLLQGTNCSDQMLTWIYRSCNQLKWFRFESKIISRPPIIRHQMKRQQLMDFINHSKNLTYIAIPLDLFTISLYREMVNIRRNLQAPEPLTLVLAYSPVPYFMEQQISLRKEYPEQKKFVKIRVER